MPAWITTSFITQNKNWIIMKDFSAEEGRIEIKQEQIILIFDPIQIITNKISKGKNTSVELK